MVAHVSRLSIASTCATVTILLALVAPVRADDAVIPEDPMPVFDVLPPDSPEAIARMSDPELLLYIVDRGGQLMKCVGPLIQREGGSLLAQKIYEADRYPALVNAAVSVMGSQNPIVQSARHQEGSAQHTAMLIVNLGLFGQEKSRTMRDRLLRAKAVYAAVLETAGVSDGECELPTGLVLALAKVPPEA